MPLPTVKQSLAGPRAVPTRSFLAVDQTGWRQVGLGALLAAAMVCFPSNMRGGILMRRAKGGVDKAGWRQGRDPSLPCTAA